MSDAKTSYKMFHDKLRAFAGQIPGKLTSNAPHEMSANIDAVTKIITPEDHAFDVHDRETIIKNVMLTLEVTTAYLKRLESCHYVASKYKGWFDGEKQSLDFFIGINNMSMANLRLGPPSGDDVDPGIGGINQGVYDDISPRVLSEVKGLLLAMAKGC